MATDPAELNRTLFEAACQGDTEQTRALIEKGADVNAVSEIDSPGAYTPLMFVALFGHTALAEALLKCGANPDAETPSEHGVATRTVLGIAVVNGRVEIVKHLLHYGVNVHATNSAGQTALMQAKRKSWQPHKQHEMKRIVALLEEAGGEERPASGTL